MSVKIYWASQHKPLQAQLAELERLFGPVSVLYDPQPFDSAANLISRFRASGAAELVVVAPLSVIQALAEAGIKPLWAEMMLIECPISDPASETQARGRCYRFVRFRRIKRLALEFEDVISG